MVRYNKSNLELSKKLRKKHKELSNKTNYARRLRYRLGSMLLSERENKSYDSLIKEIKTFLKEE